MAKEDLRRKTKAHRNDESQKILREYILCLIEDQKEKLVNTRGEAADECRGFIKVARVLLKDIEADVGETTRTNPYA